MADNNKQEEVIKRLSARIEALEKKLADKEKEKEKSEKKSDKTLTDSISDAGSTVLKESGKILRGIVDASVEAMTEAANALSSLSDDTDTEKLGEIPGAMVSVMRRTIDIQKKTLDKFEESYKKEER